MKSFQKFLSMTLLPIVGICVISLILDWDITNFQNMKVNVLITGFCIITAFAHVYVYEKMLLRKHGIFKSIAAAALVVFLGIFMFSYSATFFMNDYKGPKIPAFQAVLFVNVLLFFVAVIGISKAIKQKVKLDFPNKRNFYFRIAAGLGTIVFIILLLVNSDIFWDDQNFDIHSMLLLTWRFFIITFISTTVSFLSLYFLNKINFLKRNLIVTILLATIITTAFNVSNIFLNEILFIETLLGYFIISLFITVTITAVVIYSNTLAGKDLKISKLTASFSKKAAEYLELKNQINPHFLFNNLNTLIAFIELDPQKAVAFGHHLSNVYRYYLKNQSEDFVSLTEELTFINEYLEIYKAKFESGFAFRIEGHIDANRYILSASLQELTDNVFKHNNMEEGHPLEIVIAVKNERLVFTNSVHPKTDAVSNNSGLENISKRYKILTGKGIAVEKTNSSFSVAIPILNMEKP